jgi:hypothetical protein
MSAGPPKEKRGSCTSLKTDINPGCATRPHNSIAVNAASTVKHGASLSEGSLPRSAQKTSAGAEADTRKGHFYRPLAKEFRRDGFNYRQIARQGEAAIYEQTWTGMSKPSPCWEVVRIRRHEGFQIRGRFVEPAEVYPKSELWGVDGFTFTDKDAAFAKLRDLARQNTRRRWHDSMGRESGTTKIACASEASR